MLLFDREADLKDSNKNGTGSSQIGNLKYFSVESNSHVVREVGSNSNFNFDFNQTFIPPF
jgi:hypothetical protein